MWTIFCRAENGHHQAWTIFCSADNGRHQVWTIFRAAENGHHHVWTIFCTAENGHHPLGDSRLRCTQDASCGWCTGPTNSHQHRVYIYPTLQRCVQMPDGLRLPFADVHRIDHRMCAPLLARRAPQPTHVHRTPIRLVHHCAHTKVMLPGHPSIVFRPVPCVCMSSPSFMFAQPLMYRVGQWPLQRPPWQSALLQQCYRHVPSAFAIKCRCVRSSQPWHRNVPPARQRPDAVHWSPRSRG